MSTDPSSTGQILATMGIGLVNLLVTVIAIVPVLRCANTGYVTEQ